MEALFVFTFFMKGQNMFYSVLEVMKLLHTSNERRVRELMKNHIIPSIILGDDIITTDEGIEYFRLNFIGCNCTNYKEIEKQFSFSEQFEIKNKLKLLEEKIKVQKNGKLQRTKLQKAV